MLSVSLGVDRSGSPPTPAPRDSSLDESHERERSPRAEIRVPICRTPRYTTPEYPRLCHTQPPREPSLVPETSDDDTESKDNSESAPSSYSSSGLYSTDTTSTDVTLGRSYDSTNHSIRSSSDVFIDSDPRSPWPSSTISSGSYTSNDD
ncbi:hypothetical protein PIB30_093568 [Stylosanthes scabra]|uniref:Uncharacterized protein n=1 Tax=Stylosanthes scabra TaxID=79078 RepID=A0ABU6TVQ6_9FABA|nr:hypothetical protein [Stylosanthes scabra]